MNDSIDLNGSVVVLFHNRLVCKTLCTNSKTDVRDQWSSHVGNSPDCTTVHVLGIRRGIVRQGSIVKRFGCKCWLYLLH